MTIYQSLPIINKARQFATKAHEGQLRDDGKPYINHPITVARILLALYGDENVDANLIAAAYLHDTIEDTSTTYEDLLQEFGQDIADLVMEVTHEGDDTHGFYFPRLNTQRGIMLKFADRLSNIADMESWSDKRKAHYLKKSKFWKDA